MADPKLPLIEYIKVQTVTDVEIRQLWRDVQKEAGRIIRSNPGKIRTMQTKLASQQIEAWANSKELIHVGIGDATDAAALVQATYDEELFRKAGVSSRYWSASLMAQARAGINSVISRKENGITLSERVYKNRQGTMSQLNRVLNAGLALGKSASEIAKDVEKFINPQTPGGPHYAAQRLARTELNNAFHTTSLKGYMDSPFVDKVKWHLSGSHKVPDECNQYAEKSHTRGGDAGVWKKSEVPGKPHPNCLCYTTPIVIDEEDFLKQLKAGKFDSYADDLGCGIGA
jgi:hypothetical protein